MAAEGFGDLERWAAEARAAEVAEARVRERWLRTQDLESSDLAGILGGLTEAGAAVVVSTTQGRRHTGTVAMVGHDFLVLTHQGNERSTLVALSAVALVMPAAGAGESAVRAGATLDGHGRPPAKVTLAEVLARAAGERPRLTLRTGDALLAGQLLAVGVDVATLKTDADPPRLAYVSLTSVSEVSLFDSG